MAGRFAKEGSCGQVAGVENKTPSEHAAPSSTLEACPKA